MEDLFDQFPIIEHHGQPEGLGVLLELEVDLDGGVEQYGVFWFWDILDTTGEVCVYIEGIPWTGEEVDNYLERYRHTRPKVSVVTRDTIRSICHEEVTCFSLCTVLEAVRGNVHNQAMKAVLRGGENCPLLWDLGTHTSDGEDTKVNIKKPTRPCAHMYM